MNDNDGSSNDVRNSNKENDTDASYDLIAIDEDGEIESMLEDEYRDRVGDLISKKNLPKKKSNQYYRRRHRNSIIASAKEVASIRGIAVVQAVFRGYLVRRRFIDRQPLRKARLFEAGERRDKDVANAWSLIAAIQRGDKKKVKKLLYFYETDDLDSIVNMHAGTAEGRGRTPLL